MHVVMDRFGCNVIPFSFKCFPSPLADEIFKVLWGFKSLIPAMANMVQTMEGAMEEVIQEIAEEQVQEIAKEFIDDGDAEEIQEGVEEQTAASPAAVGKVLTSVL